MRLSVSNGDKPSAVLVQSDALDFLARIEDGRASLIYLDPPWFQGVIDHEGTLRVRNDPRFRTAIVEYVGAAILHASQILCPKGFLFLHLDPANTGTMRVLLDKVFGVDNFVAEIVWPQRRRAIMNAKLPSLQRIILCYSKSNSAVLNDAFRPFTTEEIRSRTSGEDERGLYQTRSLFRRGQGFLKFSYRGVTPPEGYVWRYREEKLDELDLANKILWSKSGRPYLKVYVDDLKGMPVGDLWDDIADPRPTSETRETRPLALLERIISLSTSEGDIIIDPFCGSGTSIIAAARLDRVIWAADASPEMIATVKRRCANKSITLSEHLPAGSSIREIRNDWIQETTARATRAAPISASFRSYKVGQIWPEEETLRTELKEVKGERPIDSIEKRADEYAVAFLNAAITGQIVWGVRDDDRMIVGVPLTAAQRDHLRRIVTEKLGSIAPAIPMSAFNLDIITLGNDDKDGRALCIVLLNVTSPPLRVHLYFTQSGDAFIKTEGGRRKLNGPQIQEETMHRLRLLEKHEDQRGPA